MKIPLSQDLFVALSTSSEKLTKKLLSHKRKCSKFTQCAFVKSKTLLSETTKENLLWLNSAKLKSLMANKKLDSKEMNLSHYTLVKHLLEKLEN